MITLQAVIRSVGLCRIPALYLDILKDDETQDAGTTFVYLFEFRMATYISTGVT